MVMAARTIPNLRMYPFNTTLMGVLKGVLDYYGIAVSDAWAFGGSGHAFIINIHEQLCPSGPYVWNYEPFYKLVRNLGVQMTDLGFFSKESTPEERKRVEDILVRSINAGTPCSLLNMENQLISGYDDDHLIVEQPWPGHDFPPKTLTFQTWKELGDEVHVNFFTFTPTEKADDATIIKDSLNAAAEIARNPDRWAEEPYHAGLQAYDAWIKAVKDGYGASHGNWWNGTVWAECREMASRYLSEIASRHQEETSKAATALSVEYGKLASLLKRASDRKLAESEKIQTLLESRKAEESCINRVEELLSLLRF